MSTSAVMRRRRPGHVWAAVEISLTALTALVLVTVAWFNDPRSLGRLGLLFGAWAIAGCMVWRSVRVRRRGHDST